MTTTPITLKYPIEHNARKITCLNMRRCTARDQANANKVKGSDADREIALFANLTETEPEAILSLDIADYVQLQKTYEGFFS